jgi:hypothetical protein
LEFLNTPDRHPNQCNGNSMMTRLRAIKFFHDSTLQLILATRILLLSATCLLTACGGSSEAKEGSLSGRDNRDVNDTLFGKPTPLGSELDCQSCDVTLEQTATIGTEADTAGFLTGSSTIASHLEGFVVAPTAQLGELAQFGAAGNLIRIISRRGGGPGEFHDIRCVFALPGDTLGVLDAGKIVILAPNLDFVREKTLPAGLTAFRAIGLPNGSILLNNTARDRPRLAILTRDLNLAMELGPVASSSGDPNQLQVIMSVSPDGDRILSSRMDRYEVSQWGAKTGNLERRWSSSSGWLKPWRTDRFSLNPKVASLSFDEFNRLWVIGLVPKVELPASVSPNGEELDPGALARLGSPYRSVLEVFDADHGTRLVSKDLCAASCRFIGQSLLAEVNRDSGVQIRIYRIVVRGFPPPVREEQ